MTLTELQHLQLQNFFNQSNFTEQGAVITDLDGTAIHESHGVYSIPPSVELGLKKIHDLGRPVVINTLRFPLSVMRTFGKEWYSISNAPIPTVLMNGSQLGNILRAKNGDFEYEEIDAFPLTVSEIDEVFVAVQSLLSEGVTDLLLFYYPRKWQMGEIIWTPVRDKTIGIQNKYLSASSVNSYDLKRLENEMKSQDICMIFLLIDVPEDKLMAYQHTKKNNFFTRKGVDKLFGAEQIANKMGFQLQHSLGAGDSVMDTFLKGVGLAIHVGNPYLDFEGMLPPLKLQNSTELGELLFALAAMQRTTIQ